MSLNVPQSRVKDAQKHLRLAWSRTREEWQDHAAAKFDQEFIAPLESKINAALGAMGRLSEVLDAARRECDKDR